MSANHEDLLKQLADICCPGHTLSPIPDAAPLLLRGRARKKQAHFLFSPKLTLWSTKYTEYILAFHVAELNFDTLAQCHTIALDTCTTSPGHTSTRSGAKPPKRSNIHITALILCNTTQAEAFEAAGRLSAQSPLPKTRLDYQLAVADYSTGEVVCNRRARKLKSKLQSQVTFC